jgi:hypothetical protein
MMPERHNNGARRAVIARQWPGEHTPGARDMHAAVEEDWEAVFSVWSALKMYSGD